MVQLNWIKIEDDDSQSTWRASVPGGWLIKTFDGGGMMLAFVPDKNHKWR